MSGRSVGRFVDAERHGRFLFALVGWFVVCPTGGFAQSPKPTPSATPKATAVPAVSPTATAEKSSVVVEGAKPANPIDDWATQVLKEDPLSKKTKISAADLRAALADPKTSDFVFERHFARAELSTGEREALLRESLTHKSAVVRRQAARALSALKLLDSAVADQLLEIAKNGDRDAQRSVVIALANVELPWSKVSGAYWKAILEALASADAKASAAALQQIERWGPDAVPSLMDILKNGDAAARQAAAQALSRIVGSAPKSSDVPPATPSPTTRVATGTVAKGMPRETAPLHLERKLDEEHPETVRVYYGTNREILRTTADPRYLLYGLPALFLFLLYRVFRRAQRSARERTARSILRGALAAVVLVGASFWIVIVWNQALRDYLSETTGVVYGSHRARNGGVHYGFCDVSIPQAHKAGEVERPLIGTEDETHHVMLRRNEELKEDAFFEQVRSSLADREVDRRNCFIFVHGYNVSFEKAALRTAQIHYDLKFAGVPMFYSWPSRANLRSYFSDRNEIGYSYEHVMKFLLDTAKRTDAKRIHVIAHSMGADAVGRAVLAMGDRGKIFDQIVLAAPDVDADVFREQIAPRLQKIANRTTLYCSRNDWALHASYAFNDSPRLGDSSRGIMVLEGLDTVDASDIDTDLLGHSYYGDCMMMLGDVQLLMDKNLPPLERRLSSHLSEKLNYWTFGKANAETNGKAEPSGG
ncbi:MAG: alpha/beta hydrolase [Planctomycetia bacterium]|nr:alpha/beta hydrolase [Planctomycetia bacterium]